MKILHRDAMNHSTWVAVEISDLELHSLDPHHRRDMTDWIKNKAGQFLDLIEQRKAHARRCRHGKSYKGRSV